jgi:hypothetical protein
MRHKIEFFISYSGLVRLHNPPATVLVTYNRMTLAEFQRVMDHFQIWYNERIPLPSSEYGDAA